MAMTGEEIYNFIKKYGNEYDFMIAEREDTGEIAVSFINTLYREKSGYRKDNPIIELKDCMNSWPGYPEHYKKDYFPVKNVRLCRLPFVYVQADARKLFEDNTYKVEYVGVVVADHRARLEHIKAELERVKKGQKSRNLYLSEQIKESEKEDKEDFKYLSECIAVFEKDLK